MGTLEMLLHLPGTAAGNGQRIAAAAQQGSVELLAERRRGTARIVRSRGTARSDEDLADGSGASTDKR